MRGSPSRRGHSESWKRLARSDQGSSRRTYAGSGRWSVHALPWLPLPPPFHSLLPSEDSSYSSLGCDVIWCVLLSIHCSKPSLNCSYSSRPGSCFPFRLRFLLPSSTMLLPLSRTKALGTHSKVQDSSSRPKRMITLGVPFIPVCCVQKAYMLTARLLYYRHGES